VHLWGQPALQEAPALSAEEVAALKRQVAVEYMFKMYVSSTVENTYGIVKLRSLMLQTKALLYDCQFLGITSGSLYEAIGKIVKRRETWFTASPEFDKVRAECRALFSALNGFLEDWFRENTLYVPPAPPYRMSRNIEVLTGRQLGYRHGGVRMPRALSFLGRKYFNLQHRFNHFRFELPLVSQSMPAIIEEQFVWQHRMRQTNRRFLPHFMPLSSSLNLS
jgi:hypothetical protein